MSSSFTRIIGESPFGPLSEPAVPRNTAQGKTGRLVAGMLITGRRDDCILMLDYCWRYVQHTRRPEHRPPLRYGAETPVLPVFACGVDPHRGTRKRASSGEVRPDVDVLDVPSPARIAAAVPLLAVMPGLAAGGGLIRRS